jgi:hypothetical protein
MAAATQALNSWAGAVTQRVRSVAGSWYVPAVTTAANQVQTTIWLPIPMHENLRIAAFNSCLTQSAIMREALDEWLLSHSDPLRPPQARR